MRTQTKSPPQRAGSWRGDEELGQTVGVLGTAGRRARVTNRAPASAMSGSQPNTTSQIAKSAKTWSIAPSAASARATVLAGSQTFAGSWKGTIAIGETDIEIVENSVRDLIELICPVSCSTCKRTFESDASILRISSIVFARPRSAR